jgi:spore coat protein A
MCPCDGIQVEVEMFRKLLRVGVLGLLSLPAALHADQLTFTPSKDNTLYIDPEGTTSNGQGATMYLGRTANAATRRALIAFNLGFIPAGSTVTQVTLTLHMTRTRAGSTPVSLHRVLADWGEGNSNAGIPGGNGTTAMPGDATWLHRFYPSTFWTAQGGDFAPSASATTSVGGEGTYSWSSATMITDIQAWVDNPAGNFGWMLRGTETGSTTTKQFETSESNTSTLVPTLRVTFTPPAGTGACCLPDGRCAVSDASNCVTLGGVFQGVGVQCSSAPCPLPTGACCLPSGFCQSLTQPQCVAQGGTYEGDAVPCGAVRCPVILAPYVDALPIPAVAQPTAGEPGGAANYTLAITQFRQQLHRDLNPTTVWGVGGTYPGPTIEAASNQVVNVNWVNDLRDEDGNFLTRHYFPVDMCLSGPMEFGDTPRTTMHLHGAVVAPDSDGDPEATILPGEIDNYHYPNGQDACTLWYHDHAMGITRLNVYMGIAGFYLVRSAQEAALNLPAGEYDIPLVIQDRSFNPDGSFYYPPMWEDHFYGDTILVNGKVWPFLNVKRGKYRFRLLNGSNSRTYTLALSNGSPFQQIGSDQGLLAAPLTVTSVTIAPGERIEVVMDFAGFAGGSQIFLQNSAPIHYPGTPGDGVIPQVMRFNVIAATGHTAAVPSPLRAVPRTPESEARLSRSFDLRLLPDPCRGSAWMINGQRYDTVNETPRLGSTEIWTFINRSPLMHPMHMHLVRFQIMDRQPFQVINNRVTPTGPRVPPLPDEAGWKDTVQARPSELTRVIARFEGFPGYYPYHCHILEHEDNEMMRRMLVLPRCDCDRNNDSLVDSNDFFSFLASFFVGNADFNRDGVTTSQDFFDFLGCFFAGCR